jgi:uncharacterized RDD family membrane protein YckC
MGDEEPMSDSTPTPPPEGDPYVPPPTSEQPAAPPPGAPGGPPSGPPGGYGAPAGPPGGYAPAPGTGYGPPPSGGVGQPADLLKRFLARLIDFILVGIVNAILTAIVGGIFDVTMNSYGGYSASGTFAASAISGVISAVLYLAYFTLMESRNGQTLGKMLLKLQTQGPGGGTPTTEQALRRNIWTGLGILSIVPILGPIVGGLGQLIAEIMIAVTISQSPVNEGWHDRFAGGTRVIRIG